MKSAIEGRAASLRGSFRVHGSTARAISARGNIRSSLFEVPGSPSDGCSEALCEVTSGINPRCTNYEISIEAMRKIFITLNKFML